MYQTAYTGTTNLIKKLPYMGGFCKFWFIPKEEIASMPPVNPLNQYLADDITLADGKAWRGPVPVPDKQLGFTEAQSNTAAGISYKTKVAAQYPGDLPQMRVNLDNMAYQQFVVVGKLRAGGFYVVIGDMETAMDFATSYDSGSAYGNANLTQIAFTHEQLYRALVLPSFNGDASGYLYPTGPTVPPDSNTEIIFINDESTKAFDWTPTRLTKFGIFPEIEVWLIDPADDQYHLAAVEPLIDAPPPSFTHMSFDFGGNVTGFIVIK